MSREECGARWSDPPPPISNSENELTRKERSTIAQQRSGYYRLLGSYKSRIKEDASLDVCADCSTTPHDVKHLFVCPAHPTTLIPSDLWSRPTDAVRELSYLEARDPYCWNNNNNKAASHHIPTGRRKLYTQQVPAEILAMMEERDYLRKQDPASPRLSTMNDEITKATSDHKRRQWREFVECIDHRTDSTKLWRTIKGIDGNSKQTAENEGITFTGRSHTSPKLISNSFNRQFTSSKMGKHYSSRWTRHVSKDVK